MEIDAIGEPRGLSTEALGKNSDFRRFAERMKGMGRVFAVKSKSDTALRVIIPPRDDEAAEGDLSREWLDCCLREYLERKRLFENRFRSRAQLMARVLALLVPFLGVLWSIWPIWRVLIDVETDAYYKALEITRGYRAMMKRWHPDNNPTCGQYCREKTERIKEAYDMLLSRSNHHLTLANQYHKSLMALRSLLSFRGFQISGDAAMNVFMILLRLYPASARKSATLRLACSIVILVFCTVHETLFVSGFSIVTVVELFYYSLSMAKASAQQQSMEEVRRNSYFDVLRDAFVLLGCASVASIAVRMRENAAMPMEEASRMFYGSVYVLSFLYRFSPNAYDNFLMRKCSLPLTYLDMTSARFTWTRFATSELMFLVDDLFVFTCRISSPYRVVVYIAHFVALCQFFMLPWDTPIINGRSSAKGRAAGIEEPKAPASASARTRVAQSTNSDVMETAEKSTFAQSYITKEEEDVVTDLDSEAVSWMDIASLKYKALVFALGRKHAQQHGQSADVVDIAPSSDLQNVLVVAFSRGAGTGPAASQQRLDVLCQVRDPEMSRLVAMERGPKMMVPARPKSPWNLDLARMEYRKVLGSVAPLTSAQVWRKRAPGSPSAGWKVLATMMCVWIVFAVACAVAGPSPHDAVRSSKGIDSSLRPQLFARFLGALPPTHFVNALSGGLLTVAQIPFCTLDWWDAGATLGFVR
ncbi:DnaJ domain family protein [Leishmania donovani]|uniref:DnaJ domain family protein n=1 Tax=Leishmania donovani TaxID=5661 RepID=A0A504XNZ5_LEIDO|nr:DnaJ domain family protein [Leishmania donovani]